MKYRSDFVTNSSSSSFIISYENPFLATIDDIYNYMKELFRQWLSQRTAVMDRFGENIIDDFWVSKDKGGYDGDREISHYIKSLFNLDVSEDYLKEGSIDWLDDCETYDDFLNYSGFRQDDEIVLPFEIIDFAECSIETAVSIASWYMRCIGGCGSKQRGREPGFCDFEHCALQNRFACDEFYGKSGEEVREYIIKYLGRWCIYVDEGVYFPLFIKDKAEILCEYYNWHMG